MNTQKKTWWRLLEAASTQVTWRWAIGSSSIAASLRSCASKTDTLRFTVVEVSVACWQRDVHCLSLRLRNMPTCWLYRYSMTKRPAQ